ncbi:MAG: hypothetical protein H0W81_06090 [Chloroflexi bacterium]|nr:hypothetical protein [Chloroflexota bacterium]
MKGLTPHLIEQACRVAELLDEGYSNRRIAQEMGVSGPRVSQIRVQLPVLQPYLARPEPMERLRCRRDQLWSLRHQALALVAAIRKDLRELDEEPEAVRTDRIMGLR